MRMLRNLFCSGLAMLAVCLSVSMPALAAVPVDAHAMIQPMTGTDHPAPASAAPHQDVAVLPSVVAATEGDGGALSPTADAERSTFADTSIFGAAYLHIDPDIAGR